MGRITVFGKFKIMENSSCSRNTARELIYAETFERLSAELPAQFFTVDLLGKDPLIEFIGIILPAECLGKSVFAAALDRKSVV